MHYIFGFNTDKTRELNLCVDELFILHWILYLYHKEKLEYSTTQKDYFCIRHRSIYRLCYDLRHHNMKQVSLYLSRLCGNAEDSVADKEYPLSSILLIENKKRNMYYKLNMSVVDSLFNREVKKHKMKEPVYSEHFPEQYNAICSIYDFKHILNATKPTQILLVSDRYIQQLLNGTFLDGKRFNREWIGGYNLGILDNLKFTDILNAIREYSKQLNNGWKVSSKKLSLSTFFYNPRTQKSTFLYMLNITNKSIELEFEFNEEREMYKKEIAWFCSQTGMKAETIEQSLYPVYTYFKEYYIRLKEQAERRGNSVEWQKQFGTRFRWGHFISSLVEYVNTKKNMNSDYVGYKNKFWYRYLAYIYRKYNKIRLSFDKDFYEKIAIDFSDDM